MHRPYFPRTDSIEDLFGAVAFGLVVFLIGRVIHHGIAKQGEAQRIRGEFIPRWMAGCYVIGGMIGVTMTDYSPDNHVPQYAVVGLAAFAMLLGLAIGLVHGTFRVLFQPPQEKVESENEEQGIVVPTGESPVQSDNPYSPPSEARR